MLKGFFILPYIEWKKILKYLVASILVNLIIFFFVYINGLPSGHDTLFHLSRIDGIPTAIADGQLPLAIYPYKNYGFSYASSLFYCDFFLIPFALAYHFGMPLTLTYKLLMFSFASLGSLFLIYSANEIINNEKLAIASGVIYSLAQYRIVNIFLRGALGEVMGSAFLPLILLACYRLFIKKDYTVYLLSFTMSAILLCHNISFLIAVVIFATFCLLNIKIIINDKRIFISLLLSTLLAIGLSAFFLFPMIEQMASQRFYYDVILNTLSVKNNLLSIKEIIFDQSVLRTNSLPYGPGFVVFVLYIYSVFLCIKQKNKFFRQILIVVTIIYVAFSILLPKYIYPIFEIIQFPWRLSTVVIAFIPIVFFGLHQNNNRVIVTLAILICFINYLFFIPSISYIPNSVNASELFIDRKYDNYGNGYLFNPAELSYGEYLPYAYLFDYTRAPKNLTYQDGQLTSSTYTRNGTNFFINTNEEYNIKIILPISYYKGYKANEVSEDGKVIKSVIVSSDEYRKLVTINAEKGTHIYHVYYAGTKIQRISLLISCISLLVVFVILFKISSQALHPKK